MTHKCHFSLTFLFTFMLWVSQHGATINAAELPAGFSETRIATGLNPTTMTFAPDGRLLLCEKHGVVRVVSDGKMAEEPLLDIRDQVDPWNERGLLSICVDPDFARNGWIYVYYTHNRKPDEKSRTTSNNRVSRFTVRGGKALPDSEVVLLEIDHLSKIGWHNGGGLAFGKDGKLYISTGENAEASNAQKSENLLGKLLRINKDGSIPDDNPHAKTFTGKNRAIVGMGLRNGFHIAVHPLTGKLYLHDVGANYEQIEGYDTAAAPVAANYGWPGIDGPVKQKTPPVDYREPVYPYDHGSGKGLAICGGDFFQPSSRAAGAFPESFHGMYFFGDYGGWIKYIDPAQPSVRKDFATGINRALDVACAPDGTLYYIERAGIPGGSDDSNSASKNGSLWHVTWTGTSPATRLFVRQQPRDAMVGLPMQDIEVALLDEMGNITTSATDKIEIELTSNNSKAKLTGVTSVGAISGVARFSRLSIDQAGQAFTFKIRSGKLSVESEPFAILDGVAPVTIAPTEGDYTGPVWVTLSCAHNDVVMRYTLDGSEPTASSPVYEKPFEVEKTTTVRAAAFRKNEERSTLTKADLRITGSKPYGVKYLPPVSRLSIPRSADQAFPATLMATGIFTDSTPTAQLGAMPYALNSSIWNDGADVKRWVILPPHARIGFSPTGDFTWPGGTILVQHFSYQIDEKSQRSRSLETRILVIADDHQSCFGASYRWRSDGRDADLVKSEGAEETIAITTAQGTERKQAWSYPAAAMCAVCHTANAGLVLGPKTHKLNRDFTYPGGQTDNQLRTWHYLQWFGPGFEEEKIPHYPRCVSLDDATASLETRVRSYLDANCAHCHRPNGTGAQWDARFGTPFTEQGILRGPVRNNLGLTDATLVTPGDPTKSLLLHRMKSTDPAVKMPPFLHNTPDTQATKIVEEWIRKMEK